MRGVRMVVTICRTPASLSRLLWSPWQPQLDQDSLTVPWLFIFKRPCFLGFLCASQDTVHFLLGYIYKCLYGVFLIRRYLYAIEVHWCPVWWVSVLTMDVYLCVCTWVYLCVCTGPWVAFQLILLPACYSLCFFSSRCSLSPSLPLSFSNWCPSRAGASLSHAPRDVDGWTEWVHSGRDNRQEANGHLIQHHFTQWSSVIPVINTLLLFLKQGGYIVGYIMVGGANV